MHVSGNGAKLIFGPYADQCVVDPDECNSGASFTMWIKGQSTESQVEKICHSAITEEKDSLSSVLLSIKLFLLMQELSPLKM